MNTPLHKMAHLTVFMAALWKLAMIKYRMFLIEKTIRK